MNYQDSQFFGSDSNYVFRNTSHTVYNFAELLVEF